MSDDPILTQACRNVIQCEWDATYRHFGGIVPAARSAYQHIIVWPYGTVAGRIRGEYHRLKATSATIIDFPPSVIDQQIGAGGLK